MILFSSDNGGELAHAAKNQPLRGNKGSFFDGGIRVVAGLAGGFIPPFLRGWVSESLIHQSDVYASFAYLAGLGDGYVDSPHARGQAGHDSDSINVIPVLWQELQQLASGQEPTHEFREFACGDVHLTDGSPGSDGVSVLMRTVPAAGTGSQRRIWKFLIGLVPETLQGGTESCGSHHCGDCSAGCLFDVLSDPWETADVSSSHPDVASSMRASLFENTRGTDGRIKLHPFPAALGKTNPNDYGENRVCLAYCEAPFFSDVARHGFCGVAPNMFQVVVRVTAFVRGTLSQAHRASG